MSAAFPIVIAEWPRNSRETLRVSLDEYEGRQTIDIRCWWLDGDSGELRPGKKGITLSIKHLPALAKGIDAAVDRAVELGLIDTN